MAGKRMGTLSGKSCGTGGGSKRMGTMPTATKKMGRR